MHLHRKFNRQHNTGFASLSSRMPYRASQGYTEFCKAAEYKKDQASLRDVEEAMKVYYRLGPEDPPIPGA